MTLLLALAAHVWKPEENVKSIFLLCFDFPRPLTRLLAVLCEVSFLSALPAPIVGLGAGVAVSAKVGGGSVSASVVPDTHGEGRQTSWGSGKGSKKRGMAEMRMDCIGSG